MYTLPDSKGAHSGMMDEQGQSDIILSWIRNMICLSFWVK